MRVIMYRMRRHHQLEILKVIKKSAEKNFDGNALDAYRAFVLSYRSFKNVRCYQERPDAMDFKEALLKAVNKQKYLIQQKVAEIETDSEEDE